MYRWRQISGRLEVIRRERPVVFRYQMTPMDDDKDTVVSNVPLVVESVKVMCKGEEMETEEIISHRAFPQTTDAKGVLVLTIKPLVIAEIPISLVFDVRLAGGAVYELSTHEFVVYHRNYVPTMMNEVLFELQQVKTMVAELQEQVQKFQKS